MFNWGIIGPGRIAHSFARSVSSLEDACIYAVASRDLQRAKSFGDQYCAEQSFDSYEDLAKCSEVDAVYISTTNPYHFDAAMICLGAGKPVLCEKPLSLNAGYARKMIAMAAEKKVFFMEAMWTRFLPAVVQTKIWISEGMIGEPKMLTADFCTRTDANPKDRWFNIEQGGGALLDLGIYPVSFASFIFGPDYQKMYSAGFLGETGVDERTAVTLKYKGGQVAQLSCALDTKAPNKALILGTDGYIELDHFFMANNAKLYRNDGTVYSCSFDYNNSAYKYEAIEVARCIEQGKLQSDIMPWDESIKIMEILDAAKAEMGLKYPQEK